MDTTTTRKKVLIEGQTFIEVTTIIRKLIPIEKVQEQKAQLEAQKIELEELLNEQQTEKALLDLQEIHEQMEMFRAL